MRKKLLSLNIEIEISEPIELEFWRMNLDAEDFYFKLDNECQELIKKFEDEDQVLGVYQYCIGVGELDQVDDLIMKRSRLLNCFTQSSTPFFIQVAKSEFKVNVVTSFTQSMLTIRNIAAVTKWVWTPMLKPRWREKKSQIKGMKFSLISCTKFHRKRSDQCCVVKTFQS